MDKELLLKPRLPEEDVELPGLGAVRVRGLSRGEVMVGQKRNLGGVELERYVISIGLVEPALSEAEVGQWQDGSPAGELEPVTRAIQRLSGMEEKADNAAFKSV